MGGEGGQHPTSAAHVLSSVMFTPPQRAWRRPAFPRGRDRTALRPPHAWQVTCTDVTPTAPPPHPPHTGGLLLQRLFPWLPPEHSPRGRGTEVPIPSEGTEPLCPPSRQPVPPGARRGTALPFRGLAAAV